MTQGEFIAAMVTVSRALDELGSEHCVGGSVASSQHGLARSTLDIDVVARLTREQAAALVRALRPRFYGDEETAADAADCGKSFNLIEIATGVKIDVFVAGADPVAVSSIAHAAVGEAGVPVASPEDTIVAKLRWFRLGGESSERQWRDVLGVLRAADQRLDRSRLSGLATLAGVGDLLDRAEGDK